MSNEIGAKLLQSVREMKAGRTARVTTMQSNEISEARRRTGLSQSEFAEVLGISRRHPKVLREAVIDG